MKKILMLCLALVMGVGMCAAEKPANKKTVTTVFTILVPVSLVLGVGIGYIGSRMTLHKHLQV